MDFHYVAYVPYIILNAVVRYYIAHSMSMVCKNMKYFYMIRNSEIPIRRHSDVRRHGANEPHINIRKRWNGYSSDNGPTDFANVCFVRTHLLAYTRGAFKQPYEFISTRIDAAIAAGRIDTQLKI